MGTTMPAVGYLTTEQKRRVQALLCAVVLLPHLLPQQQVGVARWIVTGSTSAVGAS